jgi:hypothetical protein
MNADEGHTHCLPRASAPDAAWLSVRVAAVLALGASNAYGSEDAGDIDDETVVTEEAARSGGQVP